MTWTLVLLAATHAGVALGAYTIGFMSGVLSERKQRERPPTSIAPGWREPPR